MLRSISFVLQCIFFSYIVIVHIYIYIYTCVYMYRCIDEPTYYIILYYMCISKCIVVSGVDVCGPALQLDQKQVAAVRG